MIALALVGCAQTPPPPLSPLGYAVEWSTAPLPLEAGAEGEFTLQVLGDDGEPVDDLQQNHERMVHTVFVSADLRTFVHAHQEDHEPITALDLRSAKFSFPLALPAAGEYVVAFDYAHRNQWLQTLDRLRVGGSPAQEAEPDLRGGETWSGEGLSATLAWDAPPTVGVTASWDVVLRTDAGEDVTDLVQYLGADGHCVFVSADLEWLTHTHAWSEGIEDMAPSMEMPHLYPGPAVPFRAAFPVEGGWRMWCQFARGAPDEVVTVTFPFEVAP